jgi:hypothetical protein
MALSHKSPCPLPTQSPARERPGAGPNEARGPPRGGLPYPGPRRRGSDAPTLSAGPEHREQSGRPDTPRAHSRLNPRGRPGRQVGWGPSPPYTLRTHPRADRQLLAGPHLQHVPEAWSYRPEIQGKRARLRLPRGGVRVSLPHPRTDLSGRGIKRCPRRGDPRRRTENGPERGAALPPIPPRNGRRAWSACLEASGERVMSRPEGWGVGFPPPTPARIRRTCVERRPRREGDSRRHTASRG